MDVTQGDRENHKAGFQSVIRNEAQCMVAAPLSREDALVTFKCKEITVTGLFTGASHTYAVGILNLDEKNEEDLFTVDIRVKGYLKFASMKCIRLFHDTLVCIAIMGQFVMIESGILCLADIRKVSSSVRVRVVTNEGWKVVVKVAISRESHNLFKVTMSYEGENVSNHWFYPGLESTTLSK